MRKCYNVYMKTWDYDLPKNWRPRTDDEIKWYLVRKINYGELQGLKKETIQKYLASIKKQLDPGKRALLENFFRKGK